MAKIILSDERTEEISKGNVKGSPWAKFKFLYGQRPGLNRSNLSMLLFFLPMLGAIIFFGILNDGANAALPNYGYVGVGFPLSLYAYGQTDVLLQNNMSLFLAFAAIAAVIFSVSLSGALKVIRNGLVSIKVDNDGNATTEFSHKRDFKKGIKENWYICLMVVLFWAATANGIYYLYLVFGQNIEGFLKTLFFVGVGLLSAIIFVYGMFVICLSSGYRQRLSKIFKNAFFMTFQNIVSNIFALIFSFAPLVLLLFGSFYINLIVLMYFGIAGFSIVVYIWIYQSVRIENRYPKYKTVNNAE